jgi:hypothetical protein
VAWFYRPFLVWTSLGFFVFLGAVAVPAAGQETCLEALGSHVNANETIVIVARDGTSTTGKFLRLDPGAEMLWLSVYDSQKSRFLDRTFDRPSIDAIRLHRVHVNLTVPFILGTGFGVIALALGTQFAEDSDAEAKGSRAKAVALMTGIGFLTGFVTGYGVAWAGRRVEDREFSCRP